MYAATMIVPGEYQIVRDGSGIRDYDGSVGALAAAAKQSCGEWHVVEDTDGQTVVLATGTYDAAESDESAMEFAERLFQEARS